MDFDVTWWQRVQMYSEQNPYVFKVLAASRKFMTDYSLFIRYIVVLFTLTVMFILLKLIFKWAFFYHRASLTFLPKESLAIDFWERYQTEDEKVSLKEIKEIFEEERKIKQTPVSVQNVMPMGGPLIQQIMSAVNQGLSDSQIVKMIPQTVSLIDILPVIESIRSFRDLCARKILDPYAKDKRDYARALKDMANGKPQRAVQMMNKELMRQQHILFGLKDKLLQQFARREASRMATHMALLMGFYDTRLADKAFHRAMELNPKDSKGLILFGRFRQKIGGPNDKVAQKSFLKLAKGIDRTLQNYMLNYAVEMVRKSEIRERQEEIKTRIMNERERYNEAVNIERLKVREALRLAKMRDIAQEAHLR